MNKQTEALVQRITDYLFGGGVFNPELANHIAVRDLLIDCRKALAEQPAPPPECKTDAEKTAFAFGWWKALEENRKQPAQREPTCKQNLQVWVISNGKGKGQFSWEPQDERYWTRMEPTIKQSLTIEQPAQQQEPVAWINWCAATGKRSVSFECESELASQPLYEGITQNTQEHYSKFHSWFDSELYRQKYTKDHPAYLAAQEAWNAANDAAQHRINRLNAQIEAWKVRFKIAEDALVKLNGPEQKPVATMWQHGETGRTRITMPGDITDCDARWFKAADLYTSPPPRKPWVGLTDLEMRELEKQFNAERVRTSDEEYLVIYPGDYWAWQRAIEAKLKEKNA